MCKLWTAARNLQVSRLELLYKELSRRARSEQVGLNDLSKCR